MKNKLYYVLFLLYAVVVVFVLYLNGVFTGEEGSVVNLIINIVFLMIIGVLFVISAFSFGRLNGITDEMIDFTVRLQKEYKESGGKNLWGNYQGRNDVFENEELRVAFNKYRMRIKSLGTKRGISALCDLEEYINEDLLDRAGMNFLTQEFPEPLQGWGSWAPFWDCLWGWGLSAGMIFLPFLTMWVPCFRV